MLGVDKQTDDLVDQAFMTEGVGISTERFQEPRNQLRQTRAAGCVDAPGSYHNAEPPGGGCQ